MLSNSIISLLLLVSPFASAANVKHIAIRTVTPVTVTTWVDTPTPAVTPGPHFRRQDASDKQSIPLLLQTCAAGPTPFACSNAACGFALAGYMGCCNTYTTSGSYYVPQSCTFHTSCADSGAAASLDPAAQSNSQILKCTQSDAPACVTMTVRNGVSALWAKLGFSCAASSQTIAAPDASYVLGVSLLSAGMTDSFAPLAVSLVSARTHTATVTKSKSGPAPSLSSSSSSSSLSDAASSSEPASGSSSETASSSTSDSASGSSSGSSSAALSEPQLGSEISRPKPSHVSGGTRMLIGTGMPIGTGAATGASGVSGLPHTANQTGTVTYQSPTISASSTGSTGNLPAGPAGPAGPTSASAAAGVTVAPGQWADWAIQALGLLLIV